MSTWLGKHISSKKLPTVIFEFGFFTINSKGVKNFNTFFMSLVYWWIIWLQKRLLILRWNNFWRRCFIKFPNFLFLILNLSMYLLTVAKYTHQQLRQPSHGLETLLSKHHTPHTLLHHITSWKCLLELWGVSSVPLRVGFH